MYDTYMSEEDISKLQRGDEITVRNIDDLRHDFGKKISIPCGWNNDMNELCGKTLIVDRLGEHNGATVVHAQNQRWSFSKEMLEAYIPPIEPEEISQMWEKMILGTGDKK